jgi:hypothetical protein
MSKHEGVIRRYEIFAPDLDAREAVKSALTKKRTLDMALVLSTLTIIGTVLFSVCKGIQQGEIIATLPF